VDFNIPPELRLSRRLDRFIEAEIKPLSGAGTTTSLLRPRREWARTDFDNSGAAPRVGGVDRARRGAALMHAGHLRFRPGRRSSAARRINISG